MPNAHPRPIGHGAILGYRINSTSFWEGDLEIDDVKRVHLDLERQTDIDYVSVSAGVHHSWIHTPMTFEQGWERQYSRAFKAVSSKPVLMVGRISYPDIAEDLINSGDADAILLSRQMIADEQWLTKVKEGREKDIRRCVAANYCWRSVVRGSRVQCAYNPVVGREAYGVPMLPARHIPRNACWSSVPDRQVSNMPASHLAGQCCVVYERERTVGGHVRAYGALPYRQQYGTIATWLAAQALGNGTEIKLESPVTAQNLDAILAAEKPDHIVVATGAGYRRDGFQGQTGKPISGWETGKCVSWDQIALDRVSSVPGEVLVIDEMADVAAPLTAVKLAKEGAKVRLLTRWPMIGMETVQEVYFHWIMTYLQEVGVELLTSHTVRQIIRDQAEIANVYQPTSSRRINADLIVMATARTSETEIYRLLRDRQVSVEAIGCVLAPRTVYEATLEGHRAARKLSDARLRWAAAETGRSRLEYSRS